MTFLVVQAGFALLFALFRVNVKIGIKMKGSVIFCIVMYIICIFTNAYCHNIAACVGWLCAIVWAFIYLIKIMGEENNWK